MLRSRRMRVRWRLDEDSTRAVIGIACLRWRRVFNDLFDEAEGARWTSSRVGLLPQGREAALVDWAFPLCKSCERLRGPGTTGPGIFWGCVAKAQ